MRLRIALAVVALVAVFGAVAGPRFIESRERRTRARIRFISQVFHGLAIDGTPAPLEDATEELVRAAVLRAADPNVSASVAESAVRTLRKLAEAGTDWRDVAADERLDVASLAAMADAEWLDVERDEAVHLARLSGDWTPQGDDVQLVSGCAAGAGVRSLTRLPVRDVRLPAPPGVQPGTGGAFARIDALERPLMSPAELAAWRASLRPFSSAIALAPDASGWTALDMPALAFHVWATDGRGSVFYFRAPADGDAPMCAAEPRRVVARPVVDGVPVPDGTVLIPGRLDWTTAHWMASRPVRAAGVSNLVHPRTDFAALQLAAADTLTALHPQHGLAWLTFDEVSTPSGTWERGAIVVRAAGDGPLTAWFEAESRWDMPDGTTTGTIGGGTGLLTDPRGASEVTIRGLPAGSYVVRFVDVQRPGTRDVSTQTRGHAEARIAPHRPRVEVVEPARR